MLKTSGGIVSILKVDGNMLLLGARTLLGAPGLTTRSKDAGDSGEVGWRRS